MCRVVMGVVMPARRSWRVLVFALVGSTVTLVTQWLLLVRPVMVFPLVGSTVPLVTLSPKPPYKEEPSLTPRTPLRPVASPATPGPGGAGRTGPMRRR